MSSSLFSRLGKVNAKQAKNMKQSFMRKKTGAITFPAIALRAPKERTVKFLKDNVQKEMTSWDLMVSPLDLSAVELPKLEASLDADDLMFERSKDGTAITVKTARRHVTTLAKDATLWLSVNNYDQKLNIKPGMVVNVTNVSWREGKKENDVGVKPYFCNGETLTVNLNPEYHWITMALRLKHEALDPNNRPTRYPFDPLSPNYGRLGYPLYLKSDEMEALEREKGSLMDVSGLDVDKSYYYEKDGQKIQCLKVGIIMRMWENLSWKDDNDEDKTAENYSKLASCDIELMNWFSSAMWSGITDVDTWSDVMPKQEGLAWITYGQINEKKTTDIIDNYSDGRSFKLSMTSVWLFADWIPYLQKHALHVTVDYAREHVRNDPKSGERYPDNPYNAPGGLEFVNMNEYRGNTDAVFKRADDYRFFVIGDYDPLSSKGDVDYLKTCSDTDCDAILRGENNDLNIRGIERKTKVLFAVKRSLIARWNEPAVASSDNGGVKRERVANDADEDALKRARVAADEE